MGKHSGKSLRRTAGKVEYRKDEARKQIVFSLKDFDQTQGQSFDKWEEETILAKLMVRLREISGYTIIEAINKGILNDYKTFPEKSDFKFPTYIHPDVNWAALVIGGKERVAGYIEDNVFYIVFLDKDHRFWISEKKHT